MNQSQSSSSFSSNDSNQIQSLIERFSAKHTSKIPVPVPTKNKSRRTQLSGSQQRSTLNAQIRDSVSHYNATTMNNSKVDQIIADLLIEALNHSNGIGIEFIKTPQNSSTQSMHTKLNPAKRMSLSSSRRSNDMSISGVGSVGSGKRSAHSSGKYQHIFDAIPEEKSGSLSIDSSNGGNNTQSPSVDRTTYTDSTPANPTSETEVPTTIKTISSSNRSTETSRRISPKRMPNENQTKIVASGKAAIESDQIESETWFGCFGRTHVVDSPPVDGLLMDEGILKIIHSTSLAV